MQNTEITKNIKDLEHAQILNGQNLIIILLGTLAITIIFTETENPLYIEKWVWLLITGSALICGLFLSNRKLKRIKEEIHALKEP